MVFYLMTPLHFSNQLNLRVNEWKGAQARLWGAGNRLFLHLSAGCTGVFTLGVKTLHLAAHFKCVCILGYMLYCTKNLKHKLVTITKTGREVEGPRGPACRSGLAGPLGRSWVLGCLSVANTWQGLSSLRG